MTVHWFVHPLWFQDIGAFTKEENIEVFVEWAKLAFTLFGALRGLCSKTLSQPPTCTELLYKHSLLANDRCQLIVKNMAKMTTGSVEFARGG